MTPGVSLIITFHFQCLFELSYNVHRIVHRVVHGIRGTGGRQSRITFAHAQLLIDVLDTNDLGCFPLCQTDRSEISGTTQEKRNDIFRLNRANQ